MADSHSVRARDNIIPLSRGKNFPAVFKEWRFTGAVRDFVDNVGTCELCEQERLRYHVEIRNGLTNRTIWVGSRCILRFGIAVYEGTRRLTKSQAKRKLNVLIDDIRLKACLKALRALVKTEQNSILRSALDYFQRHGSLSPKLAFVVFWRLQKHSIDYCPVLFKINLRRQRFMRDLESMPAQRVRMLWPALSPAQRKRAVAAGMVPPPNEA